MRDHRRTAAIVAVATLALSSSGPAVLSADQPHPFRGQRTARVMTRNLYIGADLQPLLTAGSVPDVFAAVTAMFLNVQLTNFPERAGELADEIGSTQPDLIGLQEVALWRTDFPADGSASPARTVALDFLQIFLDALATEGCTMRRRSSLSRPTSRLRRR